MRIEWPAFKMPNSLLVDKRLSFTARIVGAAVYSLKNSFDTCRKSMEELAALCHCSVGTVNSGLDRLEELGYLSKQKCSRYDETIGRTVNAKTVYTCLPITSGFTFIPHSVFKHALKHSRFLVLLYLYYRTGNGHRAFPSLTTMSKDLNMSRSTVNDSIRELEAEKIIYAQNCKNANGSFSNNSYFFLHQSTGAAMRSERPGPVRPRVRRMAVQRLGVILAGRRRPQRPGMTVMPYIRFRPLPLRWKPPFDWG